jgi:hypothetical protein
LAIANCRFKPWSAKLQLAIFNWKLAITKISNLGQPNIQLAIFNWKLAITKIQTLVSQTPIGNLQLEIGNNQDSNLGQPTPIGNLQLEIGNNKSPLP